MAGQNKPKIHEYYGIPKSAPESLSLPKQKTKNHYGVPESGASHKEKTKIKELTTGELKRLSKQDQDRPTLKILIIVILWFFLLRTLLHVGTFDYVKPHWDLFKSTLSQAFQAATQSNLKKHT